MKTYNKIEFETINSFDIDGVIYLGEYDGIYPGKNDIIITGKSIEETEVTLKMLHSRGIYNQVFFNPIPFDKKTRVSSGEHKAKTIKMLIESGYKHGVHFDDDDIQIEVIKKEIPNIRIVHVVSNLTEKENVKYQ